MRINPLALPELTPVYPAQKILLSLAVIWGTTLERTIATVYAKRSCVKVRRHKAVRQHAEQKFMLANLDRVEQHPTDGNGILEVKTAGVNSANFWEEGVPNSYQCQVLHRLAVTGKV